MPALHAALARLEARRDAHFAELCALCRIPSVSFAGFDAADVQRCADAVEKQLRGNGFVQTQQLKLGDAHPYVFGRTAPVPGAPTLLLYAHHDVQPAGDARRWDSPPFEPTERQGRLYGRGTADDKAGISVHQRAVDAWLGEAGSVPLNVKILVEGEEEIGSPSLAEFVEVHQKMLQADVMVLTDTSNFDVGIPSITTSLRGLVVLDVEVKATRGSLHSGMWGGPVPDAAMALSKMLASLVDARGDINIAGLRALAQPLSAAQNKTLGTLPFTPESFRAQTGMFPDTQILGAHGAYAALWLQPALAVNAIEASSRRDARNILVDSAWARVGLRLSAGMEPKQSAALLTRALHEAAPWGVQVNTHLDTCNGAWSCNSDHVAFAKARQALRAGYGVAPVEMGCGGSIPFVEPMCKGLGDVPALLLGVEDPHTNAHGDNESLSLDDWDKASRSAVHLYASLADV